MIALGPTSESAHGDLIPTSGPMPQAGAAVFTRPSNTIVAAHTASVTSMLFTSEAQPLDIARVALVAALAIIIATFPSM